jgi:hypothetical protein
MKTVHWVQLILGAGCVAAAPFLPASWGAPLHATGAGLAAVVMALGLASPAATPGKGPTESATVAVTTDVTGGSK